MQFHRSVLPNGLRIILAPMDSVKSLTALILVAAGSRYENKENNGISHFLEHMAFKGTKNRPSALEISSLIDGIGGEFNAFTTKEITGYYIKSSSNHIEIVLDVLSDMLQNSKFEEKEIKKEKGVILEELNLYEDMPTRKIGDIFEGLLYGDTPLGWDLGGEKNIIRKIKRADFMNYLKSLYSPQNMTVVLAGSFGESKARALIQKYFGDMMPFGIISYNEVIDSQGKPQLLLKKKKTEQAHIGLGVKTFGISHPDRYIVSVLSAILGGGMSSRLFHEVREKRGLAYYVRTTAEYYQDVGYLATFAGVDQKRISEAIKVILEEYNKVRSHKLAVRSEELKKAKAFIKGHLILELEDSRAVGAFYATQEILEEKIETVEKIIEKIEAVTVSDIERVAKKIFTQDRLNLAVISKFDSRQKFEKLLKF